MLAVVKAPRTRTPALEIRGHIPSWMITRLRKEYGANFVLRREPDGLADAFETTWYKKIRAKRRPGHAIRVYRENAGLSQAQLGEKLGGVPRQNISAMEKGRRGISKDMAIALSSHLNAPVERFL